MDHPMIMEIEATGYPYGYENNFVGTDSLGYEIYRGDKVLMLNDEYFVEHELMYETREVLQRLGADYKIAK